MEITLFGKSVGYSVSSSIFVSSFSFPYSMGFRICSIHLSGFDGGWLMADAHFLLKKSMTWKLHQTHAVIRLNFPKYSLATTTRYIFEVFEPSGAALITIGNHRYSCNLNLPLKLSTSVCGVAAWIFYTHSYEQRHSALHAGNRYHAYSGTNFVGATVTQSHTLHIPLTTAAGVQCYRSIPFRIARAN